jgi:23S rRNA (pseudouridine1915-N3)-methyltransferase
VKLKLVAVGTRLDDWITTGFNEYARRLPRETALELIEVAPAPRRGQPVAKLKADEAARLLAKVSSRDHVVALDVRGAKLSTEKLSQRMADWRMTGGDVVFLIGGADGLDASCLTRANEQLSLSAMTYPHGLVRVMIAEQLYRAWTVLSGHPYHRA